MHLAVAISSHGYGHGAQTCAVLASLCRRLPQLKLTLLTALPRPFLVERIGCDFTQVDWQGDFGMHMTSALDVDLARSAADYRSLHADWDNQVTATAERLQQIAPDLLLANIPYLPLAAAHTIGLPALALCSLNWAGIYRHYFDGAQEAPAILGQMVDAYNSARQFLCPVPSMAMPELDNVVPIGPLARLGEVCRGELCARLGVREEQRLVMIAPGGIPVRFPLEDWPVDPDVTWIVPHAWGVIRDDMRAFEGLGLSFVDVLRTCDALLGKLGYGTVAECGCNGTPLLYVPRPDWPEEPFLADWLQQAGRCRPVPRASLERGRLRDELEALWSQPARKPPAPTGADEAAALLADALAAI